ncbi:hypothetical protein [Brunnivagina elsteri]|nr:hypothetical protein [Calothrix elsteri]
MYAYSLLLGIRMRSLTLMTPFLFSILTISSKGSKHGNPHR